MDFGGKNIIIIGDFSQLPPVKDHILYYQPDAKKKSKKDGRNKAMHMMALNLYRTFQDVVMLFDQKRLIDDPEN